MQNLVSIDNTIPDALHMLLRNSESFMEYLDDSHAALAFANGTARTLAELQEYEAMDKKGRENASTFDLKALLLRILGRDNLPTCGLNGNLVRACDVCAAHGCGGAQCLVLVCTCGHYCAIMRTRRHWHITLSLIATHIMHAGR